MRLAAFTRCSNCVKEGDPLEDDGFVEKLERFVSEGVQTVHIGICAGRTEEAGCPGMKKMVQAFRDKGIEVIWGTH